MTPYKEKASRDTPRGQICNAKNNNNTLKKLPYSNEITSLESWGTEILFVIVCVGHGGWELAKKWKKYGDTPPLVLPDGNAPSTFNWPVGGRLVLIQAGIGPSDETLQELIKCLLTAGAEKVTLYRSHAQKPILQFWAKEASC